VYGIPKRWIYNETAQQGSSGLQPMAVATTDIQVAAYANRSRWPSMGIDLPIAVYKEPPKRRALDDRTLSPFKSPSLPEGHAASSIK